MTGSSVRPGQDREAASVREVTQRLLRDLGMTTVFGNPGSTELRFLKDWPEDFRYVMALHEGASVAMADAYAQITGNAALVNLHSAGGVGNAMGTLFTAYRNAAPLVVVAGQQTRAMLPSEPFLFAADAATLPRPYVKWSVEPARAEDVPLAIARAYQIAMERPYGPAFVSVPEDDWDRRTTPVDVRRIYCDAVAGDDAIAALAAALARSARPALVTGAGVDRDGASDAVIRLAERLGAPVWSSALAGRCGFPEDHPLFAGALPRVRSGVVATLAGCDCVVVLGAPVFNYHIHADGPYVGGGTELFQLTDDGSAASYSVAGSAIITTIGPAVDKLLALVPQRPARPRVRSLPAPIVPSDPISVEFLLQSVRETLPDDAIIVEETPSVHSVLHDVQLLRPGRFFAATSGSLGYGMGAAVGAAIAAPDRPILALIGDGSAHYAIQALWTAARHALPIVYLIVNNAGYGAMQSFTKIMQSDRSPDFGIAGVDFTQIAQGYGVRAVRVASATDVPAVLCEAFGARSPVLVDIAIDSAVRTLH